MLEKNGAIESTTAKAITLKGDENGRFTYYFGNIFSLVPSTLNTNFLTIKDGSGVVDNQIIFDGSIKCTQIKLDSKSTIEDVIINSSTLNNPIIHNPIINNPTIKNTILDSKELDNDLI